MSSNPIKQAFDCVKDDEQLADRVLEQARRGVKHRKIGHAAPLSAVVAVCAFCAFATGGTAYAIANSSFFASAWGSHGQEQTQTWTVEGGRESYSYSRTFGDGTAPEGMEDHVLEIGSSVSGNGYTLELDSMVADSNGCGAVTFTLSNPNGVSYYQPAADDGMLVLNGGAGTQQLDTMNMLFGDGWADRRCVINKDESTETSIRGVMYFATPQGAADYKQDACWEINWHEGEGANETPYEKKTKPFKITDYVEARSFSCGSSTVEVSPISIQNHIEDIGYSAVMDKMILKMKDGTERTILAEGVMNSFFGYIRDDGTCVDVVSELIDPSQIDQVIIEGRRDAADGSNEQETFSLTFS